MLQQSVHLQTDQLLGGDHGGDATVKFPPLPPNISGCDGLCPLHFIFTFSLQIITQNGNRVRERMVVCLHVALR